MASKQNTDYCSSRFQARRRATRVVRVGGLGVGGTQPIRIQSMTTTATLDTAATVRQCIDLAEAGCEIIRITAQSLQAARALKDIHSAFRSAGFQQPLVADIHFLPKAAMEAAEHVEKVRINPGNYADKKRFAQREYTDAEYAGELERIYERFSPLVRRCRELGRALRIGTNHGSLSDRIMNRYGDTPLGMVESALEFVRIAQTEGFHDIVLSMKSSHPKVMVQAYRLAVAMMAAEGMDYPLHLGVTEAGDGEDARIKSALGIGALLYDGLGDTIRVSLTENPVREIPVARSLAEQMMKLWENQADLTDLPEGDDGIDPYRFKRRSVLSLDLEKGCQVAHNSPPRVLTLNHSDISNAVLSIQASLTQTPIEGLVQEWHDDRPPTQKQDHPTLFYRKFSSDDADILRKIVMQAQATGVPLALDVLPEALEALIPTLQSLETAGLIATCSQTDANRHPVGCYRTLATLLDRHNLPLPLWLRFTHAQRLFEDDGYERCVLDAAVFMGSLLVDGLGDVVSIETEIDTRQSIPLAYSILQGARARVVKTEYVACPGCGRTLFDLQSTTQAIRARTDHLKGVTIAVMGCIVNGPGEMADADFGYVGGALGKVNLYRGKECVRYHVPELEAVDRLIDLIKEEGKWVEPTTN